MHLAYEISERAASVFLAFQKLHGLTDETLSQCVGGLIHPKTLNRQLNAVPRLTQIQVEAVAACVANVLPCDKSGLIGYILEGGFPPPEVRELLAADIFDLTEAGLTAVSEKLRHAQHMTNVYREIRLYPSPEMLTDEIRRKLYEWRALVSHEMTYYHADLLSRFAAPMRDRFMFGLGKLPDRIYVFMPYDRVAELVFD